MRANARRLFLLVLLLALGVWGRAADELLLTESQLSRLATSRDAAAIKADLESLAAFGNRFPGAAGRKPLLDWLRQRLTDLGFAIVGTQSFPVTVPLDRGTRLTARDSEGAVTEVPLHAFWPNYVTPPFLPAGGRTAPLVYGAQGRLTDFDGKPVAGRDGEPGAVVLLDYDSGARWQNAVAVGASAVVFLPDPEAIYRETSDKVSDMPLAFPRFYLDDLAMAARLRALADAPAARVSLQGGMAWQTVTGTNLLALLPANEPAEPVETLILAINLDAASLIPGLAPGGQSAGNLAAGLDLLARLCDPALDLLRQHNLLVLFDDARGQATAGLRNLAGVLRDLHAAERQKRLARGAPLSPWQELLARKMTDIDPWMTARHALLTVQRDRVEAALAWLDGGAVGPFTHVDTRALPRSELLPQDRAADWWRQTVRDTVKQQQIAVLNTLSRLEREAGVNQFTPDAEVPAAIGVWRRRKAYYRAVCRPATPQAILQAMGENPLPEDVVSPADVTPATLRVQLERRRDELTTALAHLKSAQTLRAALAPLAVTRAFVLDISAGDTMLTLDRSEVGGDRVAPSPQVFEWGNSLAPLIRRQLDHIVVLANHALKQGQGRVFDFVGEGDYRRQANPAMHGPFDLDLALAGVSSFTLVTGNDRRERRLGPGDRLPQGAVDLNNLQNQARSAALLLCHLLQNPGLAPHYEKNTPWCMDVHGTVVKQDVRAGPFPRLPVPGTLVMLPAAAGRAFQGSTFRNRLTVADSGGRFRFAGVAGGLGEGRVEGYRFSPENGMLSLAPDQTMASRGGYETFFNRLEKDVHKKLVVFEGACLQFLDAVDPMLMQPLVRPASDLLRLQEGKGGSFDSYFVHSPTRPGGMVVALIPPESHFKVLLGLQGFGHRLLLLGDQSERPGGVGLSVGAGRKLDNTGRRAAKSLYELNDSRLATLASKGVRSAVANRLHRDAARDLAALDAAVAANRYSQARYLERNVWGRELNAYPEILSITDEAVMAAILLMAFMAPWALFMERVFFQAGSIKGRIVGSLIFFAAAFALLYGLHPAFQISSTPIMILIAYALAFLALLALGVIFSKYAAVMKRWREQVGGVHESDISRAGAFLVAFNLGLSNLAKRRLRTVLTILMVALLSFSVMTFTSIEPAQDLCKVRLAAVDSVGYDGLLFRLYNWGDMDESTAENFVQDLGVGVRAVYRNWYMYSRLGQIQGPGGEHSRILLERPGVDGEAGRSHVANVFLGFMPEETRFSGLDRCVTGQWLTGAEDEIILPAAAGATLGITEADLSDDPEEQVRLRFGKKWLRVVGLLDAAAAETCIGLGGTPLGHVDYFMSGIAEGQNPAEDAKALTLPVGDEVDIRFIPFARSAIVPYALVRELGGAIKTVAARFPAGTDSEERIQDLMSRFAMNLYGSIEGKPYLIRTGRSASVEGAWKMVLPLLLVVLIMVNLMLGAVDERSEEIKMLGAVGLAPRHVSILYLAEASVYGVLGVVFGVLLGLAVSFATRGIDVGVDVNYASVATMLMGFFVLLVVIGSTLIPASRAARLATPSGAEEWNLPESADGMAVLDLPFTMTKQSGVGIFAFLHEYLDGHWESTSPDFRCTTLDTMAVAEEGEQALVLSANTWLAPYDMRVAHDMALRLIPAAGGLLFNVRYESRQTSGELATWNQANFAFIDLLRQQFLIYRTLTDETKNEYVNRARALFAAPATEGPDGE